MLIFEEKNMKSRTITGNTQPHAPPNETDLQAREKNLKLREQNIRQREIEMTASEVEFHQAMADLKEEKLNYQSLSQELHEQKALLIQICKDIDYEYA